MHGLIRSASSSGPSSQEVRRERVSGAKSRKVSHAACHTEGDDTAACDTAAERNRRKLEQRARGHRLLHPLTLMTSHQPSDFQGQLAPRPRDFQLKLKSTQADLSAFFLRRHDPEDTKTAALGLRGVSE